MSLKPTIVNEDDVEWEPDSHGERFAHRRKGLGGATDGEKLGCSLYEVPPGCRPFPYHYHTANEEAIYVLNGGGTLRTEDDSFELVKGDYVALPVGESGARQIINNRDRPLRYLCFSTMIEPEIAVHPDSGKYLLYAGSAPFGSMDERTLSAIIPKQAEIDFWDGER